MPLGIWLSQLSPSVCLSQLEERKRGGKNLTNQWDGLIKIFLPLILAARFFFILSLSPEKASCQLLGMAAASKAR